MKSVKYIIVLVSNACLLGFVMHATADPLERIMFNRLVGRWVWYQLAFQLSLYTLLSAFLITAWVFAKKYMRWNPSVPKRIAIAVALTFIASAYGYWSCWQNWNALDTSVDRHSMVAKMWDDDFDLYGKGLTYDEYVLLARKGTWHPIPKAAYNISFKSNGFDMLDAYPKNLTFYIPKGAPFTELTDEMDVEPHIFQEIEELGDSICIRYYQD